MSITIDKAQELELRARIRIWEQQRKDFLRGGESRMALRVEDWLAGAAVTLSLLRRPDLARLADAALDAPVET